MQRMSMFQACFFSPQGRTAAWPASFQCENRPIGFKKNLLKSCKGFKAPTRHNASRERSVSVGMCYFPVAPLTNDHKLDGLKQQQCVLSQIWRETKMLEVKCQVHTPSGGSREQSVLASLGIWWPSAFLDSRLPHSKSLPLRSHCLVLSYKDTCPWTKDPHR